MIFLKPVFQTPPCLLFFFFFGRRSLVWYKSILSRFHAARIARALQTINPKAPPTEKMAVHSPTSNEIQPSISHSNNSSTHHQFFGKLTASFFYLYYPFRCHSVFDLMFWSLVWREFLWGAIAGAFGEGMMHPVDTIKTRIQSQAVLSGSQVWITNFFLHILFFSVWRVFFFLFGAWFKLIRNLKFISIYILLHSFTNRAKGAYCRWSGQSGLLIEWEVHDYKFHFFFW